MTAERPPRTPDPKTIRILRGTPNPTVARLLSSAWASDSCGLSALALTLQRGKIDEQQDLVSRWQTLPDAHRELVLARVPSLRAALTTCLEHGTGAIYANAVEIATAAGLLSALGPILHRLDEVPATDASAGETNLDTVIEAAAVKLVDAFVALQAGAADVAVSGSVLDPGQYRATLLTELARQLRAEKPHPRRSVAVEAFCGLARHGDPALDDFTKRAGSQDELVAVVGSTTRPAVLGLLFSHLILAHPPDWVASAIASRSDVAFWAELSTWVSRGKTCAGLEAVNGLAWMSQPAGLLGEFPKDLQVALVNVLRQTGISRHALKPVYDWLLRHGTAEVRAECEGILFALDRKTLSDVLDDGLESSDATVQAWAATRLRANGVVDALPKLIRLLDHEDESVRETARDQLADFDLPLFREVAHTLPDALAERFGRLLVRIHPGVVDQVRKELLGPSPKIRHDAVHLSWQCGLFQTLRTELIRLLTDESAHVRLAVATHLVKAGDPASLAAVAEMRHDSNVRVRAVAEEAAELWCNTFRQEAPQS